ncbi:MAG TPA: hypothetical protein VGM31_11765 [Puia sp.]|jgi:uncharacterized membrane-anchored protein YhcB (DUF1043 family)
MYRKLLLIIAGIAIGVCESRAQEPRDHSKTGIELSLDTVTRRLENVRNELFKYNNDLISLNAGAAVLKT